MAAIAGLLALHPLRVSAEWWSHAPADFEDCADAADKLANKQDKTAALAKCNAQFAGRRKPGGGYTYYDFLQDRSFDIAGPNPTPEEQKYIDEQYTLYLDKQRRASIIAAFSAKQQQLQQASLRTPETEKVPMPHVRPAATTNARPQVMTTAPHARGRTDACAKHAFSCEWPRLSGTLNDLKKLFGTPPSKAKKG